MKADKTLQAAVTGEDGIDMAILQDRAVETFALNGYETTVDDIVYKGTVNSIPVSGAIEMGAEDGHSIHIFEIGPESEANVGQ